MILNEFFNLPQVFEKDMTEGVMSEIDLELRDIVAREDFDALYELFTANTPAGRFIQDMYDDVVIDAGLHPDDDFERIEQIVFDRLADDFGNPDMAEGAPISIFPGGDKGGAVDNFKQQMANRTELDYQKQLQGMAEAKDDYVPPREANYDDKYQAMVRRVGEKAKQQELAKKKQQEQPKAPVRESRLALLKQIIQS